MMCEAWSCIGLMWRYACDWEAEPGYTGGYMVFEDDDYLDEQTWWDYDTLVYYEDQC